VGIKREKEGAGGTRWVRCDIDRQNDRAPLVLMSLSRKKGEKREADTKGYGPVDWANSGWCSRRRERGRAREEKGGPGLGFSFFKHFLF
jgi:hypothetical protein